MEWYVFRAYIITQRFQCRHSIGNTHSHRFAHPSTSRNLNIINTKRMFLFHFSGSYNSPYLPLLFYYWYQWYLGYHLVKRYVEHSYKNMFSLDFREMKLFFTIPSSNSSWKNMVHLFFKWTMLAIFLIFLQFCWFAYLLRGLGLKTYMLRYKIWHHIPIF